MLKKTLSFILLITLFPSQIYADTLHDIYNDIVLNTDRSHQQDGITYSLTQHNALSNDFLVQFPGKRVWGIPANTYPGYAFDESLDSNFGLPHCETQAQCINNSSCSHLSTFYNGISGQNTKMCNGYADVQLDRIYNAIINAQHFVDITTLEHLPDSKFRSTIRNALTLLATTGRKVTVRILDGVYEPIPTVTEKNEQIALQYLPSSHTTSAFLTDLIRDLKNIPGSNLDIYVAGMRSQSGTANTNLSRGKYDSPKGYMSFSWNHSKIIDVDGADVITGGVNMFSKDYLTKKPLFDLMIELKGAAANKTLGFTNLLWSFVRNNKGDLLHVIEYSATKAHHYRIVKSDVPSNLIGDNTSPGHLDVLSIGRTGYGLYAPAAAQQHNTSDYAFYDLLSKAQHTIYIAQQSLKASFNIWPLDTTGKPHTNLMSALASLLVNKGSVYIVTSPYDTSIPLELGYASLATPQEMRNKVESEAIAMYPQTPRSTIDHALCGGLHIATIRFNQHDATSSDGSKIYDHYKFMMVDGHIFYLGSQNFYPSGLQNYGYIIDDSSAADIVKKDFWNKLWHYSSSSEYVPSQCG